MCNNSTTGEISNNNGKGKSNKYLINKLIKKFSFYISIFGLLFTIGNDSFSQYDYNIKETIINELRSTNTTLNFNEIQVDSATCNPKYYFILDVSGSIKKDVKPANLTKTIQKQISEIKKSRFCSNSKFAIDIDEVKNTIEYHSLLQVRLLHTLIKLHESQGNKLDYSIVLFSENPEEPQTANINETFKLIMEQKFDGQKSDFLGLLECLQKNILKDVGPADSFKRKECNLIFFSDYLHDDGNHYFDQDLKNDFLSNLLKISEKNVDVKLHYFETFDKSNLKTNTNSKLKEISIHNLFSSIFPWSEIGETDSEDGNLTSPLVSKKPIPFYYSNSLYEEQLTSSIDFSSLKKKKKFLFGLQYSPYGNDTLQHFRYLKQEYYLIDSKDTIHLSDNLKQYEIKPSDKITLMIKGYIQAPYSSPDIIIQDKEEGISYVIPVAFYKKFHYIAIITLVIIIVCIVDFSWTIYYYKKSRKDE